MNFLMIYGIIYDIIYHIYHIYNIYKLDTNSADENEREINKKRCFLGH